MAADVTVTVLADISDVEKKIANLRKVMSKQSINSAGWDKLTGHMATLRQQSMKLKNSLNDSLGKQQFQGWAMSLMFLGMAMQNMFTRIWTSSEKVFQDVAHSIDGVVTGFDQLNMSTAYLGYELGRALEPIASFLAPIVSGFADWAAQNQGTVTTLASILAVLAPIFTVVGSGILALAGLQGAWFVLTGSFVTGLQILGVVKTAFMFLTGPIGLLVAGFVLVGTWIYKTQESMGGWGNFFKNVLLGITSVVMIVTATIAGAFAEAWKWVKVGWNAVVLVFQFGFNLVFGWIQNIVDAFNAITGKNIQVGKADFSGALTDTSGGFMDTYSSIMGSYADWFAKQSPTTQGQNTTNNTTVNINGLQMPGVNGSTTIDDLLLVLKAQ